jgi:hypothetical protein
MIFCFNLKTSSLQNRQSDILLVTVICMTSKSSYTYMDTLLCLFYSLLLTCVAKNFCNAHFPWKNYVGELFIFDILDYRGKFWASCTFFSCSAQKDLLQRPCLWNGLRRPCYLFARKFYPEALNNLMNLFSNYTIFWDLTGNTHISEAFDYSIFFLYIVEDIHLNNLSIEYRSWLAQQKVLGCCCELSYL